MKGRFPEKIGRQFSSFFFLSFFLALFGLFISFLFSFNLLERLKRSAFQRRPRMIPCLLAAAAMVMRYGRLCAENRRGHCPLPPHDLITLPTPCRCLQVPQAPPMNTISNVEAARLCGSSIEWAVTVKESRALGSGITGVSATWLHRWTFPLLLQGAAAALAA